MKARFVLTSVTCGVILFMRVSSGAVITFDDLLHNTGSTSDISSHYQGLVWSNVSVMNSILYTNVLGVTGYYYGLASPSNVAVLFGSNQFSPNSEIDSPATNINFLSAYLTGAWNSNQSVEVQGFRSGDLVYDQTVVVTATNPTLFTFNCLNVDRLYFNAYGGQAAFGIQGDYIFVMDNLTFEFVPEPSSLLLTCIGGLTSLAFVRRKRACH